MESSPTITKISAALLEAQKKIGSAKKTSDNPFYKSKYADLGAVMEVCKTELNEQKISVIQPLESDGENNFVRTILLHETGEFISSRMKVILAKNDMQGLGSAITYARRYGLQSMVFIPNEDDDGRKASEPKTTYNPLPSATKPVAIQTDPSSPTGELLPNNGQKVTASLPEGTVTFTYYSEYQGKPTIHSFYNPATKSKYVKGTPKYKEVLGIWRQQQTETVDPDEIPDFIS